MDKWIHDSLSNSLLANSEGNHLLSRTIVFSLKKSFLHGVVTASSNAPHSGGGPMLRLMKVLPNHWPKIEAVAHASGHGRHF